MQDEEEGTSNPENMTQKSGAMKGVQGKPSWH